MNKSEYQLLRWSVEMHIARFISDPVLARDLCNELMRKFVQSLADSHIKRAAGKRSFRTFRRDKEITVPQWALHKPRKLSALRDI
ncbi:hypothetical protein [Pseudomonas sp. Pseu.R1]|uniref:hypothetical protein n=1 Tax=Pseudomonas sp. Pseu.R1 TaxID=3379818 RepID=UPI003B955969